MNHAYRLVWNARLSLWVAVCETARGRGKTSGTVKRAMLAAGLLGALNAMALNPGALPAGGQVSAGQASIQASGASMTITQASARAAIDWQSFNIGGAAAVTFNQPSAAAIALNRVTGQDASQIMGQLSSNGQVFLLNPNGVLFGSTAQVNVGGLVASTLGLSNDDFMAGNHRFSGSSTASVVNQGRLTAADGGYVALLAAQAKNEGVIQARLGNVSLAAGSDVTLNLNNGSLLGLTVNQGVVGALADNSHLIQAEGGKVLMTAQAADRLVSAVVNNRGVIEARGVIAKDGVIRLLGDNNAGIVTNTGALSADTVQGQARSVLQAGQIEAGSVNLSAAYALVQTQDARIRAEGGNIRLDGGLNTYLSGTVDASGGAGKAAGGQITVAGQTITLSATRLDASGASTADPAGRIRVGGGAHGLDTDIGNARTVTVSGATSLKANGKDGSIVVWSDDTTSYFGKAQAGERGFIEVSSKGTLNLGGTTEVGAGGQILYDPTNIVIDAAAPASFYIDLADPTPTAGDNHGTSAAQLANGNILVASISDDSGGTDAGAAYLYNSTTGALISALYGSATNDNVGSSRFVKLSNGNYLVGSTNWRNGAATNAGALTWGNGATGVSGVVSASNSLVGSTLNEGVGSIGSVTTLSNGNYLVKTANWRNGAATNVGAVTWGNGSTGISGAVSSANSLVGSATNDQVGSYGITLLNNGNYLVRSANWDNGAAVDAGAVTWGSGTAGVSGVISSANSLVGSTSNDFVGGSDIIVLNNNNYVVRSENWDNASLVNAGAVTWGSGSTGVKGVVSAANSLVGTTANDYVGMYGVTALTNGNYVVRSGGWDNGAVANVGAVTWGSGTAGVKGTISSANSLIGSTANDLLGDIGVTALTNGNYVVSSGYWDNGAISDAGAVTWGDGATGTTGVVSAANSLVGSMASDTVSRLGVTALNNGNYVVNSDMWDNGAASNAGAVTWGNGTTGVSGVITAANSLIGGTTNDRVGINGVTALSNGNYVVNSYNWSNGGLAAGGAVTWGSGTAGVAGLVSSANSLVGGTAADSVGSSGITALSNGNYLVRSSSWDNGATTNVGAVTWGNGSSGITGLATSLNSLIGGTSGDSVGFGTITELGNGNYLVASPNWRIGAATNVGAVTWGSGTSGISGVVSASNSLVGSIAGDNVGGTNGITTLNNGSYLVRTANWRDGAQTNVGAVTWGSGTAGVSGTVSAANSLVGSKTGDAIGGAGITALSNGNYVVRSADWDNGTVANAGAVTWGSGTAGVSGVVAAGNSLVGSTAGDNLGLGSNITELSNGNYVVNSVYWRNGALLNAGAVTWGNGTTGVKGAVSATNSLVGTASDTFLGSGTTVALANSNYVVVSNRLNGERGGVWIVSDPSNATSGINASNGTANVNPALLANAAGVGATVTLQASNDITVNSAVSVAGKLNLLAGNAMTLNAGGTITSTATGDAIVLSGNTFVNNAGSNALTASNGRWLVYSNAPAGNTFGGLVSGNNAVWNATHAANAPATIASGNRYVFAQQPTVGVTANTQSKAYDGAGFGTATYTTTGLVNAATYGTVFTQDALSGALATAAGSNAGIYAITQGTLAGPTGYGALTYTGANAVITPKAVTLTGLAATSRDYDGTTTAALTGGTLSGMVLGQTLGFSGQSGQFNTEDAGNGKAVTVSGLALSDGTGLASNYSVAQPTGLTANITPKAVTVTGMSATSRTYDGTTATALTGGAISGTVLGETLAFSGQSGQFNTKDVGNGKAVTVTGLALGNGTGLAGNYSVTQPTGLSANITPKAVTVTGMSATSR
ncbi:MAG: filamentous hemagglutinin N-terminal domain-containing protein, partial [Polaromonas sp.]|uniref:two-partner secretion domain-containing protein n=1 Tax=Polaromonas sp. TaxID=1869339 RepID=UPI002489D09D